MTPAYWIKQGALLSFALQFVQDDGTPVDITGATVQSQIRDNLGNLVATPTLTITQATSGQLTYTAQSDSTWPIGHVKSDVYLVLGGIPSFTQTFVIAVTDPVTQPAGG